MKGQNSIEFMIIFSIMMIFFLLLFFNVVDKFNYAASEQEKIYAKSQADLFASKLNDVFLAGNGANSTVELSGTLKNGKNYSISIYPASHAVTLFWDDQYYSSHISTSSFSGLLTSINNSVNLSNKNGVISIAYAT